jgi:broad specificity phosphatase PhoE
MNLITLVRHGESECNVGIFKLDPDITENGRMQAKNLSGEYDLVIISNLARTRQTLQYSKITYKELIVSDLCREYRGGHIGDHVLGEEIFTEGIASLYERVIKFREFVKSLMNTHQRILVISHGIFISYFTGIQRVLDNCESMLCVV